MKIVSIYVLANALEFFLRANANGLNLLVLYKGARGTHPERVPRSENRLNASFSGHWASQGWIAQ